MLQWFTLYSKPTNKFTYNILETMNYIVITAAFYDMDPYIIYHKAVYP